MWASIISKAGQLVLTYFVMPLFSKLVVIIVEHFQNKIDEAKRNKEIDEQIKKYKESATPEEQEDAFKNIIRGSRARTDKL